MANRSGKETSGMGKAHQNGSVSVQSGKKQAKWTSTKVKRSGQNDDAAYSAELKEIKSSNKSVKNKEDAIKALNSKYGKS